MIPGDFKYGARPKNLVGTDAGTVERGLVTKDKVSLSLRTAGANFNQGEIQMKSTLVTVDLPVVMVDFLQKTAIAEGLSVTDVISRAISSEKFLCEQEDKGRALLVEYPEGLRKISRK